jgi:hypothetical protein
MQIKSIVAAAAIALVTGVGSVSAADDQFTTIAGVEAQAMTNGEMGDTKGAGYYSWPIKVTGPEFKSEDVTTSSYVYVITVSNSGPTN